MTLAMDWNEERLADICSRISVQDAQCAAESVEKDAHFDLRSFRTAYFNEISLANAVSVVVGIVAGDPGFDGLGVNLDTLNSFFLNAFLHILPQKYHNLEHSINTLCFGSFILRVVGRIHGTDVWDRVCFMIALCLHDIGHPGEPTRGRINDVSHLCGDEQAISFEMIHVAIFRKIALRHFSALCRGLGEDEMEARIGFIGSVILATDLKLNRDIIDEFDLKYLETAEEDGMQRKRRRTDVVIEMREIEYKMAVKLADLSACYKEYDVFNRNSISFWSEVHDRPGHCRSIQDMQGDICLLEKISIPLVDSFSTVFRDLRPLFDQAAENLRLHRMHYEQLVSGTE